MRPARARGQALLEFTLVLAITLFLMLTVFEVSRMLLVYATIANSARAGVRYACVHGSTRNGNAGSAETAPSSQASHGWVDTRVNNFASMGLVNRSRLIITVTYLAGTNNPGDSVSVSVVYPYDPWVTYFPIRPRLGSISQGVIAF